MNRSIRSVLTCHKKNGRLIGMQLHLPSDVLAVEVGVPPPPLTLIAPGPLERDAEVTLGVIIQNGLLGQARGLRRRLHHRTGGPFVLVHGGALAVLCLPRVVHLETAVELVTASFQQLDIAGGVDRVTQLRIFPFGEVVFALGQVGLLVLDGFRSVEVVQMHRGVSHRDTTMFINGSIERINVRNKVRKCENVL